MFVLLVHFKNERHSELNPPMYGRSIQRGGKRLPAEMEMNLEAIFAVMNTTSAVLKQGWNVAAIIKNEARIWSRVPHLILLYIIFIYYRQCSFWTCISERIFTCSWASEASLSLLLAQKYCKEVPDLNANRRLFRERFSSVVMKLVLVWDFPCECESYTLASCDTTLRMLPRPFTRLTAP